MFLTWIKNYIKIVDFSGASKEKVGEVNQRKNHREEYTENEVNMSKETNFQLQTMCIYVKNSPLKVLKNGL